MARVAAPTFVGRRAELAKMDHCLADAVQGRAAPVVLLVGEAGVGKTRALQVFLDRARDAGATVMLGGCLPLAGSELPYAPLAQALRGLHRAAGAERLSGWLAGGYDVLARLVPDLANTAAPARPLDVMPDPHVPGPELAGRLFATVLAMIDRMTADGPVVLAIEDVHWADRSSRDLLAMLLRAVGDRPLLTVLTCRSDELPPAHPVLAWLSDIGRAQPIERLELTRLGRDELNDLLSSVLGAPPQPCLADRIFARSEGNPFFAEELLALQGAGDGMPATVLDAVLCRVAELPDAARELVRIAAIAAGSGQEVPHELLANVLGWSDTEVMAAARAAVAAHVLGGSEHGYTFRHGLTREAVENDLMPVERSVLQASVAKALEALYGATTDPVALARIAHHWYAAGRGPRALTAAITAGTAASAAYAYAAAAQLFERAIELWPQVPQAAASTGIDEARVYERAAEAIYLGHHAARAEELAREALGRIDETAEPERAARMHLLIGAARWAYCGDVPAALHGAESAIELLPEDSAVLAEALATKARFLVMTGGHEEVLRVAERAAAMADVTGAPGAKASALISLGTAHQHLGDDAGLDEIRAGRRLAERIGDGIQVGRSHINLATALDSRGRYAEMIDEALAGVAASVRFGVDRTVGMALRAMTAARMIEIGRWDEADRISAQAVTADGNGRLWAMHARAALYLARGDFTAADTLLAELFALLDGPGDPQIVEPAYTVAAELSLLRGDPARARSLVRDGLVALQQDGVADWGSPRLCWLGWRAEADAVLGGVSADPGAVEQLRAYPVVGTDAISTAYRALADAEIARMDGASDPALWDAAIAVWDGMGARYLTGYPMLRAGEAAVARGDRALAAERVRAVWHLATELTAGPLLEAAVDLARRARIPLDEHAKAAAHESLPHGLTAREGEVLGLIAAGMTNREIAGKLFISEHTVGVHVSRVLAKLGASRRTEAAAAAHRLGLVAETG